MHGWRVASPEVRVFVGDARVSGIPLDDRGLAYGDGVFETMRAHRGELPWWDSHWARLERGASRLGLALPRQAQVREEAGRLLDGTDAVLRLQLDRGRGGRGYAPSQVAEPVWILARHPLPAAMPPQGISVRWCATRLAIQPALAGIKHCNRLEQVLARAEWLAAGTDDGNADDGLMCSTEGDVVSATAANLFVLHGDRWRTPLLDRCGVAGVCRQWLLDNAGIEQARLAVSDIETADAVVLTNAVRGILPVARLGARRWRQHPAVLEWQRRLARAHPGFAATEPAPSGSHPSSPSEMP